MTNQAVPMKESPIASDIYPAVTEALLTEAVRRVRQAGAPLQIVLFGSRAEGRASPDSDIDILVVEEPGASCRERESAYREAVSGLFPDWDVLAYTIDEVMSWRNVANHLLSYALKHGRILFEDRKRLARYYLDRNRPAALVVKEDDKPKTHADLAKEWFANADSDLGAAKVVIEHTTYFNMACFHAQQAIEKYFKGFLLLHGQRWSKTHNLDELRWQCCAITTALDSLPLNLKRITEYCAARYKPGFWPPKEDAASALAVADQVRATILAAVPPEARP